MTPGKCVSRLARLRAVEGEYRAAVVATEELSTGLRRDSGMLTRRGLTLNDFRAFESNLEATYLIRLFAEFETGLKDFWTDGLHEPATIRARDMIESVAARRKVSEKISADAHSVRRYRNQLVHEEGAGAGPVSLSDARRFLCRFFSHLPPDW